VSKDAIEGLPLRVALESESAPALRNTDRDFVLPGNLVKAAKEDGRSPARVMRPALTTGR
jgi:hypothetical protein